MRAALATSPADDERAWAAVVARDRAWDNRLVFAVTSTGVYCRPSCPARRPRRDRVRFFDSPAAAAEGGFRACRRCRPDAPSEPSLDERLEEVRRLIEARADEPLTLATLARYASLSAFHLQRTFKARYGLSPGAYGRAVRADRFAQALRAGASVTDATYDAGFGSSRAAYEQSEKMLGMTPRAYRAGGAGERIRFASAASRHGRVLVAATDRGVCAVELGDSDASALAALRRRFPAAALERAATEALPELAQVLAIIDEGREARVPLDVRGSAFQWKVWRALQEIPRGETRSYRDVARRIGRPRAVRAVAQACAANQVAVVIPCHRVVRADGAPGGYRWGADRKTRLLAHEARAGGATSKASARRRT
jgi:AraC family transcriptional regulator of adaptative response/methylated-DNA-[protein]-cysteine methyltransferase